MTEPELFKRPEVRALISEVRTSYVPESATHDHTHLERVAALGLHICESEDADPFIVVCAAWLHDLHRSKRAAGSEFFVSPEAMDGEALGMLSKAGVAEKQWHTILAAIHYTDSFSFSDRAPRSGSPEARVLRDADNLDALGAIGIARAFCFGGAHEIPIWVDDADSATGIYHQSARPASTVHHFHEKLLRLIDEFETARGRSIAKARNAYLRRFLEEFDRERRFALLGDADLPSGEDKP